MTVSLATAHLAEVISSAETMPPIRKKKLGVHSYCDGTAGVLKSGPNIPSTITAVSSINIKLYKHRCNEQKAPDNSEVHRSHQNCGFSVWNLRLVSSRRLEFGGKR